MATTVRRSTLTLPAAPLGPENPLPALLPLDEAHTLEESERAALPVEMARQVGYGPLRSVLPTRILDGYGRRRSPTSLDTLVIENDRLRATVLPGLGGRVSSLFHKPSNRELLYTNPVLQPADFALNGAWFSGGIEWNIGATGHTTLSCAPLHAARVPAPGGDGAMVRLWEWERLRDVPFQVDLWLPEESDFLYVGARIRNPHDRTVPVYWWSNIAVPEDERTRVLAPAEETWYFAYERKLRRIPVPEWNGADLTYPLRGDFPADYFYEVPDGARKWIASLDEGGRGLVQTSTDVLRGRKLFVWGAGPGGRRWQQWLTEPGTPGYVEVQAGLARTQLEHVPLEGGGEFAWLEAYGPLAADPGAVHGDDWAAARAHTEKRLEAALPRADVEAAYAAWRPCADSDPDPQEPPLAVGSGWGALEGVRGGFTLPGTPFGQETLDADQRPWAELLHTGSLPCGPGSEPPGPTLVSPEWRELLESADTAGGAPRHELDYHLGVAQWHAGDRSQAVRSWERSVGSAARWPALRCLAVADRQSGNDARAAERYLAAVRDARERLGAGNGASGTRESESGDGAGPEPGTSAAAALTALAREAVESLLRAGRADDAEAVLDGLHPADRLRGRFQLLRAQVLLAQGDIKAARAVFERDFEVEDLREGEEALSETWAALTDEPLPARYDFRMRPAQP
ncbi:DUF5107 domain-containing protein [Streptomyces sp. NBC_01795]|uniref:DUF5107 domain-containing protein n=1 Tax=unclassified Streptomyces TaxID=2593676 RepID=UPI002DDC1A32|nr:MULTISPECIES: DUF5107 domain-containing protein [unclassified Streptomyces]WSA91480.1 DUF5107 domain-containing protein [Streptomyces sp. NBC_01795]WSB75852.1 DUF5107 domain-containing protein [Streptomyces sp. NBC_01775]